MCPNDDACVSALSKVNRARKTVLGKLLASSSLPNICFGSRVAMQQSATPPASTPSAPLTSETLRRHVVGTESNAATRGTGGDVHSQPSVTSSMGNISSDAEDLQHWLEHAEAWTVEIGHWNSSDVCMKLNFDWEKGENYVSLGWVVNQMEEKLGNSLSKGAVVVLLSPETHVTAKLDHGGCYLKVREFLRKCILKRLDCNDFKVSLQYHLWSSSVGKATMLVVNRWSGPRRQCLMVT